MIHIMKKGELEPEQLSCLNALVSASVQASECGPCVIWDQPNCQSKLFVANLQESQTPIAILFASGPDTSIDVSWYVAPNYRAKYIARNCRQKPEKYSSIIIDRFAEFLKARGVTGVGEIKIRGNYHIQSSKLLVRFKKHFE